ncbi:MAG: class I SAM-dependent methyltransferase [Chthoniobacterales bacterium]
MESEEYAKLNRVEREHWFYSGKRRLVQTWIARTIELRPDSLLLDCGAGTGLFAREMAERCRVLATDDHADSLQLLRENLGGDRVLEASCTELPLPNESIDCLTALDVLEHVREDVKAAAEFWRVLKPGGVAIITVPAMQNLWSDWDAVLHHFRRYDRKGLRCVLEGAGFQIEYLNYINVFAFPLIWLTRKLRRIFPRKRNSSRLEEFIPPVPLNNFLRASFVSLACQTTIQFPFGVGLLAIARRVPN